MIYLIAAAETGLCKIGTAEDIGARLAGLQTACPFALELVAAREGGSILERKIHSAASAFHKRGEWFHFSPAVLEIFHATAPSQGPRSHFQIIRDAGAAQLAAALSASIHTVQAWARRDSIPAEHWRAFVDDGHATLDELADAAADRKRAA